MKVLIKEGFPVEVLILELQALSRLEVSTGGCINYLAEVKLNNSLVVSKKNLQPRYVLEIQMKGFLLLLNS